MLVSYMDLAKSLGTAHILWYFIFIKKNQYKKYDNANECYDYYVKKYNIKIKNEYHFKNLQKVFEFEMKKINSAIMNMQLLAKMGDCCV